MMAMVALALLGAGEPVTVQILAEACSARLVEATRAEFETEGFEVVHAPSPAVAAIVHLRCTEGPAPIEVRIDDHLTHKAVERNLEVDLSSPRGAARAAVLVLELLHASLVEARFQAAPRPKLPVRVERWLAEPPPSPWRVSLGAGVLGTSGPWRVAPALAASVARHVGEVEVGAEVVGSAWPERVSLPGGRADVDLLDAQVSVAWARDLGVLHLRPRLGVGALLVWAIGHADAGFEASTALVVSAAPTLGLSASVQVQPWLALRGDLLVGAVLAPVWLQLDATTRLSLGRPFAAFCLGISVR